MRGAHPVRAFMLYAISDPKLEILRHVKYQFYRKYAYNEELIIPADQHATVSMPVFLLNEVLQRRFQGRGAAPLATY